MSEIRTNTPATLDCPTCGQAVTYYDPSGSWFYACPHCHAYFEYENEGPPRFIQTFRKSAEPLLPLGTTGTLNEQPVSVVGHIRRKDTLYSEEWSEYMLLTTSGVYWQLAEFDGHWTLITPAETAFSAIELHPKVAYVETEERRYELYNRYTPKTLCAVGEFDWNILEDDELTVSEYISPPFGLVCEKRKTEETWYTSAYQTPADIRRAFGGVDLPEPYSVGALQPSGYDDIWKPLQWFSIAMAALLVTAFLVVGIVKPQRRLAQLSLTAGINPITSRFEQRTATFTVVGPTTLGFDIEADLSNTWVELEMTLVNEQTGRVYDLTKALEFYQGVEDGESWSEGSRTDEAVLARVPSGRYRLTVTATADQGMNIPVALTVDQQNALLSNFLVFALLLLIYPTYQYFQTKHIEEKRWAASDYGPENQ